MAGVKISQLQDGGALQATDAFPVARGSLTRKILGAQLLDPLQSLDTRLNALSSNTIFVANSPTIDLTYNNVTRTLSADVSTTIKNASAINVVDSPTIDLDWNASTRTLSAVTTASVATSSSPMVAKAWLHGTIGTTNANTLTYASYNCSMVWVKAGVVRIIFTYPFTTENSFVFTWGSAEAGTQHHVIAESVTSDSGLTYTRKTNEIVLGLYREGTALETAANGRINVVFYGT